MTSSKILPVSFLALMTVLGGLTLANAQGADPVEPAAAASEMKAKQDGHASHGKGHGGHRGGMMREILRQVDANGDRAVTQAEVDTFRTALVIGADESGEGDISLDEFETVYLELTKNRMVDAFQDLDADGDGAITQAEMDARFGNIVERMDRNGDGQLDRADRGKMGGKRG